MGHSLIQDGDIKLEAELLEPDGGREAKPAVVFIGGSGQCIYQVYPEEFIEEFVLEVVLRRDTSVRLINKPGLGDSDENWMHNYLQGRSGDNYAAVQYLQRHPMIELL